MQRDICLDLGTYFKARMAFSQSLTFIIHSMRSYPSPSVPLPKPFYMSSFLAVSFKFHKNVKPVSKKPRFFVIYPP